MSENVLDKNAQFVFVEDEKDIREFLIMITEGLGYTAIGFENPDAALEYNKWDTVSAIISDYRMPGKTGIEFCEELRARNVETPFILLSAFADKTVAMKAVGARVIEIVEKPVDVDQAEALIKKYSEIYSKNLEVKENEFAELIEFFVDETKDLYKDLEDTISRLADVPLESAVIDLIFRKVHSVKGGASAIPQAELLARLSHEFESRLSFIKNERHQPGKEEIQLFQDAAHLSLQLAEAMKKGSERKPAYYREAVLRMIQQIAALPKEKLAVVVGEIHEGGGGEVKAVKVNEDDLNPSFQEEEIMVKNSQLDQFMQIAGEFVILKNYFQALLSDVGDGSRVDMTKVVSRLENFLRSMEKSTQALQIHILEVRKVSLKKVTAKLQRIVRQSGKQLGKKIDLVIDGEGLKVDKSISTAIGASLTHMVRNSLDHGVEAPSERLLVGKAETGRIKIDFIEKKESIYVAITDDGRGLNLPKIKKKALEKNLISENQASAMSDEDAAQMIFLPGFSTADQITDVSGRGVGMDAAMSMVEKLNGKVKIDSTSNQGTSFSIQIPFLQTVSVERSLIVMADQMFLAIPIDTVRQIISGGDLQVCDMNNHLVMVQKDRSLPLVAFNQRDGVHQRITRNYVANSLVITLQAGRKNFALIVDKVLQQTEAVTQPLPDSVVQDVYVEGTTIIGDDRVAYVIDPEAMINSVISREEFEELSQPVSHSESLAQMRAA